MTVHRVLFVCLGNICRSPTAEGVFRQLVEARGLAKQFQIDSAGTGDWHIGAPPDARAQRASARRGIDLSGLRARQVNVDDFVAFDYLIAMDHANHADLSDLAEAQHQNKIQLFLDVCAGMEEQEVPDPYYGDEHGYDQVLDLIERASIDLLDHIVAGVK